MLYRLMYCSTGKNVTDSDLRQIRQDSMTNNLQNGITGALTYSNNFFMQSLEGSAKKVNEVFANILQDPRHEDVFILLYSPIITRMFDSFEMHVITEDEITRKIFFKYSSSTSFNPYEFDPRAAELLLAELNDIHKHAVI